MTIKLFSEEIRVQNVDSSSHREPNQVSDRFVTIDLKHASLGKHQLIAFFLHGTRKLRPRTGDLAEVLEGLSLAPFEPLDAALIRYITLKMAFLLAITSLKKVGDQQALSVISSCLEFAILHPRPSYVPKVPSNVVFSIVLHAFHPPPHDSAEQRKLYLLSPVMPLTFMFKSPLLRERPSNCWCALGPLRRAAQLTNNPLVYGLYRQFPRLMKRVVCLHLFK